MGSWYDPALGTFKAIGKLPLPKLTGLLWAPGELGGRTFPETSSQSQCSRPSPHPALPWPGDLLGCLLLYLPFTASGALFLSTVPLPGCPAGTNGSPPLKDLKRPKVSDTYLTHHPARTPIPVGATVSGRAGGAGRGCHCCPSPYLLVTGHTTQEPSQAHTVLQTWCQGRQAQVSQGPPPQI